ncbi:MAG: ribose-5-phosphate isomerase RpiA [Methanolinea sp.]|nr:ribose-5-phosphate isomerase RpiA [Methanolinea sp.]
MTPGDAGTGKRNAGERAAEFVRDGMVVGLGTGSTTYHFLVRLAERIKAEGLSVAGVPTSHQTAIRARELGIPLATLDDYPALDLAVDGTDQVDPALRLIKGRGAALTREKVVAAAAARLVIVADREKVVPALSGTVPLEVIPFAATPVIRSLREMGGVPVVREGKAKDGPVITDNGNYIVDCTFPAIPDPEGLEDALTLIPGVLECGLFCKFTGKTTLVSGSAGGVEVRGKPV